MNYVTFTIAGVHTTLDQIANETDACVSWLVPANTIELIPKHFSEHILYLHYELDPEKAKCGLPIPNLINVDEACLILKTNRPNLFKLCAYRGIGVYIRKQIFQLKTHWMNNDKSTYQIL